MGWQAGWREQKAMVHLHTGTRMDWQQQTKDTEGKHNNSRVLINDNEGQYTDGKARGEYNPTASRGTK